jgi:hypothetical protein
MEIERVGHGLLLLSFSRQISFSLLISAASRCHGSVGIAQ